MVTHKHLRLRFATQKDTAAGFEERLRRAVDNSSNMKKALPLEVSEESDHEEKKAEFPPGTRVLKFFQRQGWIEGEIEEHNEDRNEYIVLFPNAARRSCLRDVRNLVRLAKINVGSRVAIWWPDDKCFYNATVTEFRPKRHEAFRILYDDDEREWIDFRKHKFELIEDSPKFDREATIVAEKVPLQQNCENMECSPTKTENPAAAVAPLVTDEAAMPDLPVMMDESVRMEKPLAMDEPPMISESSLKVEEKIEPRSGFSENIPSEVVPVLTESTSMVIFDKVDAESVSLESQQIAVECAETQSSGEPIFLAIGTEIRVRSGQDGSTVVVTVSDIVAEDGLVKIQCLDNTFKSKHENSDDSRVMKDESLKIECLEESIGDKSKNADPIAARDHESELDCDETHSVHERMSSMDISTQIEPVHGDLPKNCSTIKSEDVMENCSVSKSEDVNENGSASRLQVVAETCSGSKSKISCVDKSRIRNRKEECKTAPMQIKYKQTANEENPRTPRATRSNGNNDEAMIASVRRQRKSHTPDNGDVSKVTVGTRVEVYWPDDAKYYGGLVTKHRNHKKSHYLVYDDGETEWIDFCQHKFRIVDSNLSGRHQKRKVPNADNISKKRRRSSNSLEIEVGKRVAVWWAGDRRFYKGTVTKHEEKKKKKPFYVEYDDGDTEWIDLQNHRVRILHKESVSFEHAGDAGLSDCQCSSGSENEM